MEADLTFEILDDSEELEFDLTEAALKPEQEKTVTPIYDDTVVVLPDAGKVLSKVTVEPIPEPTDTVTLTENDTFDVRRVGTAVVQVPQGVFPEGTLPITENGTYNVTDYAAVTVNITPTAEPVLLDSVDVAELSEPINRIVFSIDNYDLSNYHVIWIEGSNISLSARDWQYFSAGTSTAYTGQTNEVETFKKVAFVKLNAVWHNMVKYSSPTGYGIYGDATGVGDIKYYPYAATTIITGGKFNLYAL